MQTIIFVLLTLCILLGVGSIIYAVIRSRREARQNTSGVSEINDDFSDIASGSGSAQTLQRTAPPVTQSPSRLSTVGQSPAAYVQGNSNADALMNIIVAEEIIEAIEKDDRAEPVEVFQPEPAPVETYVAPAQDSSPTDWGNSGGDSYSGGGDFGGGDTGSF